MADSKNVFISHVHADDHGLQKLKDLLAPKGIDIRDSSIHTGKINKPPSQATYFTPVINHPHEAPITAFMGFSTLFKAWSF